jgi:ABC transporter with metal-binding/Fe-S-binding domain ATP-binding protein
MANACLYSGGKDSTLALHKAVGMGIVVDLLITMLPKRGDSYMFHYPNLQFTKLQAEALGIRQVFAGTSGEKEKELEDLEMALKENGVDALVTGATSSRYQFDRIGRIADKLGIDNIAPLWRIEPLEELREIASKFDAIITSVSAEGLDETFLGKRIDDLMVDRLMEASKKYKINPVFEGGEAESFVLDAPLFMKRIEIASARKEWNGVRGTYIIESAKLLEKNYP